MLKYLSLLVFLPIVISHFQNEHETDGIITGDEATEQLFQGDIKLTPIQAANMKKYGNPFGPVHRVTRAASARDSTRWPNAVIPYAFDCSVGKNYSDILTVNCNLYV